MKPRGKTKGEDLLSVLLLLLVGLIHGAQFLPGAMGKVLKTISLPLLTLFLVVSWYQSEKYNNLPPEEQRDLDRQWEDERGRMVERQAAYVCRRAGGFLLVGLYCLFNWKMGQPDAASVVFLFMVLRLILFFAVRWWLNRKY